MHSRTLIISLMLSTGTFIGVRAQVSGDSIAAWTAALQSGTLRQRISSLGRIAQLPVTDVPSGTQQAVISELLRVSQALFANTPVAEAQAVGSEEFGEYCVQLATTVASFGTADADRALVLSVAVSGGIQRRVARLGDEVVPQLVQMVAQGYEPAGALEAMALAWFWADSTGAPLSDQSRSAILNAILAADASQANKGGLAGAFRNIGDGTFLPLANAIVERASSEHDHAIPIGYFQMRVIPILTVAANRASSHDFVSRTQRLLGLLCSGSLSSARQDACVTLSSSLSNADALIAANQQLSAHDTLLSFAARVDVGFQEGIWNDREHRLLADNARYLGSRLATTSTIYLQGSGASANPPTLSLTNTAPTATSAKYKDSPAIAFSGGNPWVPAGTWTAPASLINGTLAALANAHVWLGLKNSDDIGTNFDIRVEAYKNGTLIASGEVLCIQEVTRNAANAKEITASFAPFSGASFNGTSDALALRVLTRIGTTGSGSMCGGHSNAVGLRLYFDATNRPASFDATF